MACSLIGSSRGLRSGYPSRCALRCCRPATPLSQITEALCDARSGRSLAACHRRSSETYGVTDPVDGKPQGGSIRVVGALLCPVPTHSLRFVGAWSSAATEAIAALVADRSCWRRPISVSARAILPSDLALAKSTGLPLLADHR